MVSRLRLGVIGGLCLAAMVPAAGWQRYSKQEADRFQSKLNRIVDFGNTPRSKAPGEQQTPLSDTELNSYLRHHAKTQVPVGIVEPTLNSLGDGKVSGQAIVDLDAVRKQKERGWMDPLGYLSGTMPLTARGTLTTQDGIGKFQLESASISGITIPKTVLQELLSYYSRSAENPSGINMDDPFELPARIKEIRVGKGEAIVVQ